jgi:hypothetical protein
VPRGEQGQRRPDDALPRDDIGNRMPSPGGRPGKPRRRGPPR